MTKDIVGRVQRLLLSPKSEWDVIDGETVEPQSLVTGYVAPLAAIPAVAMAIGWSLLGIGPVKIGVGAALMMAATQFVLAVVFVFILAFVINALAPSFGAQKNFNQALKVAAYSATAGWVAGIFMLIPMLGILTLVGALYSLYLLYVGLPKIMKPAAGKETSYTVVSIVVAVAAAIVINAVVQGLAPKPSLRNLMHGDNSPASGELAVSAIA